MPPRIKMRFDCGGVGCATDEERGFADDEYRGRLGGYYDRDR